MATYDAIDVPIVMTPQLAAKDADRACIDVPFFGNASAVASAAWIDEDTVRVALRQTVSALPHALDPTKWTITPSGSGFPVVVSAVDEVDSQTVDLTVSLATDGEPYLVTLVV